MTARRPGLPCTVAALSLLALGIGLRAIHLGGPDFGYDEFYHVFAARSLLGGEGLELADGRPYDRASLVTLFTAGAWMVLGESEATARLPALLFGVALLAATYVVARRAFGAMAALAALVFAALSPDLIDISRFARLYSPLAFAYLVTAAAAFLAVEAVLRRPPSLRAAAPPLAVAACAFALALHLHPVALGLGATVHAYVIAVAAALALSGRRREAAPYAAAALLLALVGGLLALLPAVRAAIRETALTPLDWYAGGDGGALAYHHYLIGAYGWFWYLVWPSTIVAVVRRPRAGLFLALAFWVPFVLVSAFVATRAPRYISHLLPFAWLLLGVGAATALEAAWAALDRRLADWLPHRGAGPDLLRLALGAGAVAAALVPPLWISPSVRAALTRPSRTVGAFATGHFAGWRAAAAALGPHLEPGTTLVASVPFASRYYLHRRAVRLIGPAHTRERWEDEGRLVVQGAGDLAALRARGPVVVVLETWRWKTQDKIDETLRSALLRSCRPIDLPRRAALEGFACSGPADFRSRRGLDP